MAQAIATYVYQNSLDGVDFDIEDYPSANLQIELIQNTRQLLGNNAIISYTPKTPASTTAPYDAVIKTAHPYLTDISIMAYDAYPGYNYQQDIDSLIAMGVPTSKIVVGLMPGYDDVGHFTSVNDITTVAQYIKTKKLGGIMFWDLNRDHENQTGLGVDAATNGAWNVFSSP
jgi:GH18 family chitinase